jgi:magnesium-transporting ATPase (P-type)
MLGFHTSQSFSVCCAFSDTLVLFCCTGREDSLYEGTEQQVIYMKGAPELLISHCSTAINNGKLVDLATVRGQIQEQVFKAASQGMFLVWL